MGELLRPNVAAMILDTGNRVLLCERSDEPGHWQFPQGGWDVKETAEEAVLREAREELGSDRFNVLARIPGSYPYRWVMPRDGFVGQEQTYFILKFLGSDGDLRLDPREFRAHRWVERSEVASVAAPIRREVYAKVLPYLERFVRSGSN